MICHQTENRRFGWLVAYLLSRGRDHERAQWAVTRNLPTDDPELAAVLMQASASQNLRVLRPAHHFVLEFAPADRVDRTLMERVADRLLAELGLGEHQAVFVAHHGTPHPHLHVMANRVHPETGRGWSTWHSWSRAREVLCELEKAFGLRPLAPVQLVHAVAQDLRSYARLLELGDSRYRADLDASAVQARWTRLELTAEQARATRLSCDHAFAHVFQDSAPAYHRFVAAARQGGIRTAVTRLRERPEQFGALLAVEGTGTFRLKHTLDDGPARAALPSAVVAAEQAVAAAEACLLAAESVARELDRAFERELGVLYREPHQARVAFQGLAREQGVVRASAILRERPAELGALHAPPLRVSAHANQLAARGIEVVEARAQVNAARVPGATLACSSLAEVGRAEMERAAERVATIRAEERALPSREKLEERLGRALNRVSWRQWPALRTALAPGQYALALKLRHAIRGTALGRDDDEHD